MIRLIESWVDKVVVVLMNVVREVERGKGKKKGGDGWELMELYKSITDMADFWDHSLVDSMKARNRVEWTDGGSEGANQQASKRSGLACRCAPVSIGVKASCLPPTSDCFDLAKTRSLYGLASSACLAYPDHHCCFL